MGLAIMPRLADHDVHVARVLEEEAKIVRITHEIRLTAKLRFNLLLEPKIQKASGRREPPPPALSEPDLNLSAHPAPIRQTLQLSLWTNDRIIDVPAWRFVQ